RLHCKAPREENIERAAAPRGSAACNRLSQGQKRTLFQLNVSGHIAGMTPIQRRDFRLDEKAGAAFRKAKKKIQILTRLQLLVEKSIGLEDRTTEQGAVQSHTQPAHAPRARDRFELRSQCFEPKSFTDDDCNAVVRRELERLTCYPPRRTYVVAIEKS